MTSYQKSGMSYALLCIAPFGLGSDETLFCRHGCWQFFIDGIIDRIFVIADFPSLLTKLFDKIGQEQCRCKIEMQQQGMFDLTMVDFLREVIVI